MTLTQDEFTRPARLIDPTEIAVMVVDMQNDYCHSKGFQALELGHDITKARSLIPRITDLTESVRKRGGHIAYTLSARAQGAAERDLHRVLPRLMREFPWRGGPQEGTWGAEIVAELAPRPSDLIIRKSRYDAFVRTNLEGILRGLGVTTIIFCGVALNGCVESTLRSAFHLDFDVMVASDCVSVLSHPYRVEVETATLETIDMHFGLVDESRNLLKCIR